MSLALQDGQTFGVDAPGNHRLPESLKLRVLSLLHDHYSDFEPTLVAEKLRERRNITVSVETLRKWMAADGLYVRFTAF
ncbi:helix-turn-helix domain-containing protein [Enterobacter hormaechei]|nr:helix-turn-helix domain-containing protein [Enterobacter hormaechei]